MCWLVGWLVWSEVESWLVELVGRKCVDVLRNWSLMSDGRRILIPFFLSPSLPTTCCHSNPCCQLLAVQVESDQVRAGCDGNLGLMSVGPRVDRNTFFPIQR